MRKFEAWSDMELFGLGVMLAHYAAMNGEERQQTVFGDMENDVATEFILRAENGGETPDTMKAKYLATMSR